MTKVSIKQIRFLNVSGFLVYTELNAILVDTGHPKTTDKFLDALAELGKKPENVGLIILTHTHFDHAGGAKNIKSLTGAELAVHKSEADFLKLGRTPFPKGTRWKAKMLVFTGRIFARRMERYPKLEADILIDEEFDLHKYGIPGRVVHTPGHTEGSVSVFLENNVALVGDNVLGISLKEHFPPFANNRKEVFNTWEKYIEEGVKILHPAHGKSVKILDLINEIEAARKKYL